MPPFERTVCDCADCVACCKRQPGPLVPDDLGRLHAAGINIHAKLVASHGGVYGRKTAAGVLLLRVPTITPRSIAGRCVFLDMVDRCSIHAIAPFGCAYFDTHMSEEEANERSVYMASLQMSEGYQRAREELLAPPKEES